jgi:hypothetical protein
MVDGTVREGQEFWHAMGWVFFISAIVVPITGRHLDFGGFFVFAASLGCFMGAVYMVSTWQRIRV